jgi:hypothetical protein
MNNETLEQLVDAIEESVISVVGEEFVTLLQTEEDCFTIKIVIPKDEE